MLSNCISTPVTALSYGGLLTSEVTMIDPDISSITLELEIMALFDAIPDNFKTQRFWGQLKRLCPDALLTRLLPTTRNTGG